MMVNINNGTERLNEDLKYDELVEYKNCTLSDLLNVVIDRYIPKLYEKYIKLNMSSYKGIIEVFLFTCMIDQNGSLMTCLRN